MTTAPAVLVVGAGAVGQVFAHHLRRGGARVTFFVRERHRAEVARGFDLVRLRAFGRRERARLEGCDAISTAGEVARGRFDQAYLAVPSTGLRGAWLQEFVEALGDATLVATVASPDDRAAVLAAGAAPERLVDGLLSLVSYRAPLGDEDTPPGTAYWFPPASPCLFSGPAARTDAVVAALSRGGLPARRVEDVPRRLALPTAALMPQLLALEAADWSLDAFVQPPWAARGADAAREAIDIARTRAGPPPFGLRFVATRPWLLRAVLRVAGRITPFPLALYLRAFHQGRRADPAPRRDHRAAGTVCRPAGRGAHLAPEAGPRAHRVRRGAPVRHRRDAPDDTASTSEVEAPEVVRRGDCYVRTLQGYPCHGAPLPGGAPRMRVEVCDGCRTHRDCRASQGGRCIELAGNTCTAPARVCRYPNDACARCEGRPTFERLGCVNDQLGHAVCMRMGAPPPAGR